METLAVISFGAACYFAGCITVFVWGIRLYNRGKKINGKVVKFPDK